MQGRTRAGKEAVWYRRRIEVPKTLHGYDLSGADVAFQFRVNANGPLTEIIYFNGRRVALGDDLKSIDLFTSAKPGDKVLVAVKIMQSADDKEFRGATMKVRFASNRPSPEDLREEFVSASALIPALAPSSTADAAMSTKAVDQVDLACP